jgi:4-diphosphocytidyl-2-C-methyl-D-erythritol kinase
MPATDTIELTCPAKVNLALSVGSPLPSGMHPIASWMVALVFGDTLHLARTADATTFDIYFASDAPSPSPIDWPLAKDLAFRAHAAMEQAIGKALRVRATLSKRIPTGAGLGGGSSDAAAMLVGLNRLFDLQLSQPQLCELAMTLGSDVAFLVAALHGHGSAVVTGLGETVEATPLADVVPIVLAFPGFGCPTGAVYGAFDKGLAGKTDKPADAAAVRAMTQRLPVPQAAPFNDLAAPACTVQPLLADAKAKLEAALNIPVHITGSGATLFVIAPSAITGKVLARKITAETGLPAVSTRTLAAG